MMPASCPYTPAPVCCGPLAQPGVTRMREPLDWSHQETTPDQALIEAVLETLAVTDASLLPWGSAMRSLRNALPTGRTASMA